MNHLEIEYKTLLTKDEYNRLAMLFSHVTPVTQTNYYIDTIQGDMKSKKLSLRIRTLPTHGELTLKIPEKVGNMEYNVTMDCAEAKAMTKSLDFPDCQIKSILLERGVKLEDLTVLGHLTTTRREYQTNIGLMALDVNVYADKKDYELELEVLDAEKGKDDFDAFLKENNINFKYAKSKVARFVATLKRDKDYFTLADKKSAHYLRCQSIKKFISFLRQGLCLVFFDNQRSNQKYHYCLV